MSRRPPQLSAPTLGWAATPTGRLPVPRAAIGSATGALAITEAMPATWLLVVGIARRRFDPIAVLSTLTVAIALAAYALTGGDPLAFKLRRGAVTGTLGIASVALGRPLLLMVAEHRGKLAAERQWRWRRDRHHDRAGFGSHYKLDARAHDDRSARARRRRQRGAEVPGRNDRRF